MSFSMDACGRLGNVFGLLAQNGIFESEKERILLSSMESTSSDEVLKMLSLI